MADYTHTHLTWVRRSPDTGESTTYVHVIPDRERAAAEVMELMLNPDVYAVRALEYPRADGWVSNADMPVPEDGSSETESSEGQRKATERST